MTRSQGALVTRPARRALCEFVGVCVWVCVWVEGVEGVVLCGVLCVLCGVCGVWCTVCVVFFTVIQDKNKVGAITKKNLLEHGRAT